AHRVRADRRRDTILGSIRDQGKLTEELETKIAAAATKAELEDIYLPYKPKRRTKAEIARERGLGPLAEAILADRAAVPAELALAYIGEDVADAKAALEGARDILSEQFAENADLVGRLRTYMKDRAFMRSRVVDGKQEAGAKFSDYFDHVERWANVPSHRALAMLRGRNEEVLSLDIEVDADDASPVKPVERMIADAYAIGRQLPGDRWLMEVAGWTWRIKLSLHLTLDLMRDLRERAEEEAIHVFARNLKDLLLAAPAGSRATMGLDPGIRTGVKVAVVDGTGKLLATTTVYPFLPRNDVRGTQAELAKLIRLHKVELISIGNGTGSRETERLVADMLSDMPAESGPKPLKVIVSEAGASVYSASATAAAEFPGLDVSLRGAVSIARRLQDPLAELVKIEPKSIGVGQYQHDVDQYRLGRSLEAVVEDAVNAVGVDLNTASAPLLARVSGLGISLAEAIIAHRDAAGPFASRRDLLKVARLGPRAFEQCAGFLRIPNGSEPLDASAVHPEAYGVAKKIVASCGRDVRSLMGDSAALKALDPRVFVDERFGLPTVRDILAELEKPGRDPRPGFKTATFADGVDDIKDLKPGMLLEGTVTNVAAFGAFIDIGVHQDGLVHVSQLADRFVKDAHEVVKAGDVVKVRVVEVDIKRKRIGLSMRRDGDGGTPKPRDNGNRPVPRAPAPQRQPERSAQQGTFGAALADALKRK
ncbi:Tex family protein, partial [Mesorhizobium sp.]|uniref:Tex family protein n=1 Tax=Mesorhizobium sp. TaxID=1871066 RepID=UPI0025B98558